MAELADALRSGRSEGSLMWVQVPPSAQDKAREDAGLFVLPVPYPLISIPFQVNRGLGIGVSGGIIRVNQAHSSLVKTRSHRISSFVSFLCRNPL